MKKVSIILSLAVILVASITLSSCEKSATDSLVQTNESSNPPDMTSQFDSEVLQHALAAFYKEQHESGSLKSGAEFIPAFYTSDGFGFIKDAELVWDEDCGCYFIISGELAFFSTELDENDFYRLNPDGSVSVHITSKNADAFYANIGEGTNAWGGGCNLTMNYSGAWVVYSFEWEGVIYTYQFVDAGSNPSAVVWHGAGKVQYDGAGPKHNLVAHLTANQGWTHVNYYVNVN